MVISSALLLKAHFKLICFSANNIIFFYIIAGIKSTCLGARLFVTETINVRVVSRLVGNSRIFLVSSVDRDIKNREFARCEKKFTMT